MNTLFQNKTIEKFEDLIYPMEAETFEASYWEQEILILRRENPKYFNSLFTIQDVDRILDQKTSEIENIKLIKNQESLDCLKYRNADGSINLNQVYVAFANGYSVVINELDLFWEPAKNLCQNLRQSLNHKVMANMYLTPKNQKALLPHYDTHDVFVLQVHGKKTWKLYDTDYKTPMLNSFQPVFEREQLKGEKEITVRAGDVMYIPRGVPHEALTTDESSIHLTIGVYPTQWTDLLMKSIHQLAHSNLELRKSLPMGFLNSNNSKEMLLEEMNPKFESLKKLFFEQATIEGPLQFIAEDFRKESKPIGDGHFAHIDQLDNITIETKVIHRQNMNARAQSLGSISRIIFSGNVIKGPRHISPCFDFIANAKEGFCVNDIPLINDTNKIKFVKRLIRGGLLKIQE